MQFKAALGLPHISPLQYDMSRFYLWSAIILVCVTTSILWQLVIWFSSWFNSSEVLCNLGIFRIVGKNIIGRISAQQGTEWTYLPFS